MIQSLSKLLPSVPASPPPAASTAGECDNTASVTSQRLSCSGSVSCSCEALDGYESPEVRSVFKVFEDENALDDWEFAGDEEREDVEASAESSRYLAGAVTVPNLLQLSLPLPAEASLSTVGGSDHSSSSIPVRTEIDGHVDEELGQSSACDWLEPPPPSGAVAMQEKQQYQISGEGVMLEAFQQFQHNPQIQEMVVALATDARVWRAVLANEKLQEYRVGNVEGDIEVRITKDFKDSGAPHRRVLSNFVLVSHNSLRELKEGLREQIRGIMEVVDKRLQAETRQLMLDVMLRAFTMMTIFMLTLIAFLFLLPLQVQQGT